MWGLSKRVVTVLLAATTSQLDRYSPTSTKQIATDFREFYSNLEAKVSVYTELSPTIKFSFVTPPGRDKNWYDNDVVSSDAYMMKDNSSNKTSSRRSLLEQVSSKYATKQDGTTKPIVLYLPGLDGVGLSSAGWQFNDLSNTFEMWRMIVSTKDRSNFGDILKGVSEFADEVRSTTDRPIYLIAESMGGLLASGVALKLLNREKRGGTKNPLHGMVLVNPATAFGDSNWDVIAPILANIGYLTSTNDTATTNATKSTTNPTLPSPYSILGGLTLASLIPSPQQFDRILEKLLPISNVANTSEVKSYFEGFADVMNLVSERIPPELLEHRLKNWLMIGESLVNPRLEELDLPVLVVAGSEDKLLRSSMEANRLRKRLPNCEKLIVNGGGHFVLDENVNLTEAIIFSKSIDPLLLNKRSTYDPILDWKLPPRSTVNQVFQKSVQPLVDNHSPVFISTDNNGKRAFGLGNLPKQEGSPLLFVSNHQLVGSDINIVVGKFIEQGLIVRGLGHPMIFQGDSRDELGGRTPGLTPRRQKSSNGDGGIDLSAMFENFRRFGAVLVTPKNYYRLLQTGQNVLLFPGGIREAYHGRDEGNKVMWPDKIDFVRVAARFNATIIPFSSVGMAESFNIVLESHEARDLPFLSGIIEEFAQNATSARYDMKPGEENFVPPIAIPSVPARNYFLFDKPVSTANVDPKDKEACRRVYEQIRDTVQGGLDTLVKAREADPFNDTPRRLAYERLTGTKAPTFDIGQVN